MPIPTSNAPEPKVDFNEAIGILWRRKVQIALITVIAACVAFLVAVTRTPSFEAEGRVLLEEGSAVGGILGDLSMLSSAPPATAELEVLQSRMIVDPVVAPQSESSLGLNLTLRVDDLDRYSPWKLVRRKLAGKTLDGALSGELALPIARQNSAPVTVTFHSSNSGVATSGKILRQQSKAFSLANSPLVEIADTKIRLFPEGDLTGRQFRLNVATRREAVERVLKELAVSETARGSGVLQITYKDTDPDRAAQVVNNLISSYAERSRERLALPAEKTVTYIEGQVERIQLELAEAEAELVAFQEEEKASVLSDTAQAIVGRMSEIDLEQAKLVMMAERQNQLAESLRKGSPVEEVGAAVELDPQTSSMLQELAGLIAQARALEEKHTEKWPPLIRLRGQIKKLRTNISNAVEARGVALKKQIVSLDRAISRWQGQLDALPAVERKLAKFQRKANAYEQIYTYLLGKEQEARIAAGAAVEAISIVDWAVPPLLRASPRLTLSSLAGILLGLFLGSFFALWRESSQKKIRSTAQMEAVTGLTQWASIPDFRHGANKIEAAKGKEHFLALLDAPDSRVAEAYRGLRANLTFAAKRNEIKSVAITSASQGEGKSTTIADLAISLANSGATVLLVDADLRRPSIHKLFSIQSNPGLVDAISGESPCEDLAQQVSSIPNLHILPSGKVDVGGINPGDLLAQEKMSEIADSLRGAYDYVFFDVPPVLAVADASSFLNRLDAILLLVRFNLSSESEVAGACHRLKLAGAKTLGAVLNGQKGGDEKDYYYEEGRSR